MDTQPVIVALALGGCVALLLLSQGKVPQVPPGALARFGGFTLLAGLLAASDYPDSWRLADVVAYLAEPSLEPFRLLVVLFIGSVLFTVAVALLYFARR